MLVPLVLVCHRHITLSLVITYNSLPYKDSPTPQLAAKRSTKYSSDSIQIQFRSNSNSIQFQFTLVEIPIPILKCIDFY
ncbi:hypothetical protein VN97_g11967 [Penicillium thymicola]|uniref:Uncharacterized protein n=1 Tax=Penicillium thymicola TaxID=293382 RepID=A0AAI9T770_PENTH|nr:hypothetical protein VN97_g11967 [Penicillium thymicola]